MFKNVVLYPAIYNIFSVNKMENSSRKVGLRIAAGFLVAITIIFAVFASGVTLPGLENNPSLGSEQGRLTVLIIDAPVELHQLNVTVKELEVHKVGDGDADGGWMQLMEEGDGIEFNLLYLQDGRSLELASEDLDFGTYNKIRMYVSEASASYNEDADTVVPLNVPSGKIDVIVEFEIIDGNDVIVTIDMQPDWAAISNSKNLRPVLKASITEELTTQIVTPESTTNGGETT